MANIINDGYNNLVADAYQASFDNIDAYQASFDNIASQNINASTAFKFPVGTTAERPPGEIGQVRYNSDLARYEGYDQGDWKTLTLIEPTRFSIKTGAVTSPAPATSVTFVGLDSSKRYRISASLKVGQNNNRSVLTFYKGTPTNQGSQILRVDCGVFIVGTILFSFGNSTIFTGATEIFGSASGTSGTTSPFEAILEELPNHIPGTW